jgi:hypothetical protein
MALRHFTLEEANELLPAVRVLVERLLAHRRKLVRAQEARGELAAKISGNGGGLDPRRLQALDETIGEELSGIARCVTGINEIGALVKDLDSGLVDFPTLRGGEEVFLCWKLGEHEIGYWHGVEEGFAGRKPL